MNKLNSRKLLLGMILVLFAALFLIPFYFVLVNSFKPFSEIVVSTAKLPKSLYLDNYIRAWDIMNFPTAFMNSLIVTVCGVLGLILVSSLAAYRIVRYPTRFNKSVFVLFIAAMIIPIQSIMIPLMTVAGKLEMTNSTWGLIAAYFGFGAPFTLFFFHGFIKSVPREIEEAAIVDGCSIYGLFFKVVFPLLVPVTVTVSILNVLSIWNDFLLPFLFVNSRPSLRTIPLSTYMFFGEYTRQWDLAMAALMLGIAPILLFFFMMQKYIVEGITAGSIKG